MKTIPQINDSKKVGKEWLEELALNITKQIQNSSTSKQKDIKCWEYYNEFENDKDFDYLRKFGEYILPSKVRHIGIQRPKINNMASIQARRPFVFSTFIADLDGKNKKYDKKLEEYFKAIQAKIRERKYTIEDQMLNLNAQKESIQSKIKYMQQMMDQTQDQQQKMNLQLQLQDMQVLMPRIESQMNRIQNQLDEQMLFTDDELETMEEYLKYNFKDIKEELAQKVLLGLRRVLGIERKSTQAFIDKMVSGKEFFYVDYIPGEKYPKFENINDVKVYYPNDPDAEYTHQGKWVAIEEEYTYEQIIKQWGGKLDEKDKKKLEDKSSSFTFNHTPGNYVATSGNKAIDNPYSGSSASMGNGINVKKIWFRVERPVYMKYVPNKYTGDFYRKTITNDDLRKEPIQEKKGEKLETKYIDDIYYSVVIDYNIVADVKLKEFQYRHPNDPSFVPLPVMGRTFNSITDRPYSLIWATRHLQDLYKILQFQEELLVALSGVKGQVVDLSQLPKLMTKEEQAYHRKLGRLYIETIGPDGRPKNISFNQWQSYDDTLSQSVVVLSQMKESIDQMCYRSMGITPQTMGVVAPTDLVGTSEIARDQAALTTAILYHEHDELERLAIEQLLNITIQQCISEDFIMTILDNKLGSEDVIVPKGLFKGSAMEVGLINALQDEQNMKELKMLAMQQNAKGLLPFDQMVKIYNIESVKELEKKLEYFAGKAQKIASMNAQGAEQADMDKQKALIQFAKEYEIQMTNQKNQIESMKIEMDKARLQMDQEKMKYQAMIDQATLGQNKELKVMDISAEREIEAAYLQEQNRAATTQERLQAIQLQLDAMSQSVNIALQNKDLDLYKNVEDAKHKVEIKKANIVKKERNRI